LEKVSYLINKTAWNGKIEEELQRNSIQPDISSESYTYLKSEYFQFRLKYCLPILICGA
jgi:hypothetical protein